MELHENDTKIGYEEGGRSLIEKIIGERKSNFSGVRNATTKRWGTKGTLQSDYARTKCLLVCF